MKNNFKKIFLSTFVALMAFISRATDISAIDYVKTNLSINGKALDLSKIEKVSYPSYDNYSYKTLATDIDKSDSFLLDLTYEGNEGQVIKYLVYEIQYKSTDFESITTSNPAFAIDNSYAGGNISKYRRWCI